MTFILYLSETKLIEVTFFSSLATKKKKFKYKNMLRNLTLLMHWQLMSEVNVQWHTNAPQQIAHAPSPPHLFYFFSFLNCSFFAIKATLSSFPRTLAVLPTDSLSSHSNP